MKNKVISIAIVAILMLGACAPQATPTTNPLDVQHTAEAAAFTMVAETQASIPTNTPVPTETLTPVPTVTLIASPTLTSDPSVVNTPTGIPTLMVQQPTTSSGGSGNTTVDTCNKTLTEWHGPTALFNIVNETRPQGTVVLSLYVVTPQGECGYLGDLSRGPIGTYSAGAFVDGPESFKVFGGFYIQEGNWQIVIRNNEIIAR
jgi:hypothetical protein